MKASRRHFLFALSGLVPAILLAATTGHAGGVEIAADEAFQKAQEGELLIVDVRSTQEWQDSGVPQGARRITIHGPEGLAGFVAALRQDLDGATDRPVALICAGGRRSTMAQAALQEAGFSQVFNVKEGMFGSDSGPGWLQRSLPLDACQNC